MKSDFKLEAELDDPILTKLLRVPLPHNAIVTSPLSVVMIIALLIPTARSMLSNNVRLTGY